MSDQPPVQRRAPHAVTAHRLTFFDQAGFELHRHTGRQQLMQCVWLYDRAVDLDALQAAYGRMYTHRGNRLIEPSPLPFGRPRWVHDDRPAGAVPVSETILPRAALLRWANAHARTPMDAVKGPAWHIAVQPFDDGTTAVSMVGSHLLFDGLFALQCIRSALVDPPHRSPYLARGQRRWMAAVAADVAQALLDTPRTLRAFATVARGALRRRSAPPTPSPSPTPSTVAAPPDSARPTIVDLPAVTVFVETAAWNARARALGGHGHSLIPAVCARIAQHLGRCRPSDGTVSLVMPVDRREGPDDDRALAMAFHTLAVEASSLPTDIRPLHQALMASLRTVAQQTDDLAPVLPVVAWMPRAATGALVNSLFNYAEAQPVTCSNIGDLSPQLGCIDGTPCHTLLTRAVDVQVSMADLTRTHGHLVIVASRYNGRLGLSIEAYQPGFGNTAAALAEVARRVLDEFGLPGDIEC